LRKHARPRDGEAVALEPQPRHESHILSVTVIVIVRHIPRVPSEHLARPTAELIPDALSSLFSSTFYLKRSRCSTPDETLRKPQCIVHAGPPE